MNDKYFQTRSKSLAYALNYIGYSFYKFKDDEDKIIYSFKIDDVFYEKLNQLNDIKFR